MIRKLTILAFLISLAFCADHDVFKNCSRIAFCNTLRDATPSARFTVELDKLIQNGTVIVIPISNTNKQNFNLYVSILAKESIRIKILEEDSKRYELVDVLEEEPEVLEISVDASKDGSITIKPTDSKYNHKAVVTADPFDVEFYYDDDTLQSVLKGDRLIFDATEDSQAFAFQVEFKGATKLYGLHHHAVDLELPTTKTFMDPFRLRNSDNANYEVGSPMALYGSVPVVYGHSKESTSGIFLHNAAEQWVDISYEGNSASSYFMVESAALDLFVFLGKEPKDVVRQLTKITGTCHMPQLWTLGYHQCRWSYYTQEDVKEVVAQMDNHRLPMDAIWLDIDYTDGYRYFTWNPQNYSDPVELQKNLSSTNRKLVTILDPHIKIDDDYDVYAEAKGKYFVKWNNGSDFEGVCWPGTSSYLDFLNPQTRDYYASWYSYDKFKDSTPTLAGVWNDMNEPSVFDDSTEKTMPFEILHYGNVKHRDIHNIYGFLQTKATHQGLMERDDGTKRPFILTRSHFAGSQRYAAVWTGDNTADWPYLRVSYAECILSNLVGLVFCGADVGGFFSEPEPDLLRRWYQAAIWLPFFRGHASKDTERREPYLFNLTTQTPIRLALETRYSHIPMWYTTFYEHTRYGDPVIKPLFYEYPGTVAKYNHILVGSGILATPVMEKGVKNVTVDLPGDANTNWYRVDDRYYQAYKGGGPQTIKVDRSGSPYFYRGGSIITRKDEKKHSTTDMLNDPYSLYVNLDSNKNAEGTLYVDDFTSFDYKNGQLYCYFKLTYIPETEGIDIEQIDGNCTNNRIIIKRIVIHSPVFKGGEYTRTEHTSLANGTLLTDVKIVPHLAENKKITLRL